MVPYINTQDGITVILNNKPVHVARTNKYYEDVVAGIEENWTEEELQNVIESIQREVNRYCQEDGRITYTNGVVSYLGEQLYGYAVDKLVSLIHAGKETTPLIRFLEKLQLNPSMQTREDLYAFLEHGKIPINEQGNFLAYKAVTANFKDIHTNTFDNSIGAQPSMLRAKVDDRREQTCSRGFHVCSYDYLPSFSHADGHVVVCEINPADVVSIPVDYNNTKMRVCTYKVIGEVENWYQDRRDLLGGTETWDESYEVHVKDGSGDWSFLDDYDALDNAIDEAELNLDSFSAVKVINDSGVLMYYKAN